MKFVNIPEIVPSLTNAITGTDKFIMQDATSPGTMLGLTFANLETYLNSNLNFSNNTGTIDGTMAANHIPYGVDSNSLTQEAGFEYDPTTNILLVDKIQLNNAGSVFDPIFSSNSGSAMVTLTGGLTTTANLLCYSGIVSSNTDGNATGNPEYRLQQNGVNAGFLKYVDATDALQVLTAYSTTNVELIVNGNPRLEAATTGKIRFNNYTSATAFTGTEVSILGTNSSGEVITLPLDYGEQTSVTGNAGTVTTANGAADSSHRIAFHAATTGAATMLNSSSLVYNPSTEAFSAQGEISAGSFTTQGNIDGNNLSGTNTGDEVVATATVSGTVELFSNTVQTVAANAVTATAAKTYGVQLNSSGQAVVNVPWTEGTSLTVGSIDRIPFSNSGGTDFDYSSSFYYTGSVLHIEKGGGASGDLTEWKETTDTTSLYMFYDGVDFQLRNAGAGGGNMFMKFDDSTGDVQFGRYLNLNTQPPAGSTGDRILMWDATAGQIQSIAGNTYQTAGTYNTIIGTDTNMVSAANKVMNSFTITDGVIQSYTTTTMTLGGLGFTGDSNANYITNNNELTNGANYVTATHSHAASAITSGVLSIARMSGNGSLSATPQYMGIQFNRWGSNQNFDATINWISGFYGGYSTMTNGPTGMNYDPFIAARSGGDVSAVLVIPRTANRALAWKGYSSSGASRTTWQYALHSTTTQSFGYTNTSNSPTYVWATNSSGTNFLAARASMSVNYATSAGSASTATTATNANNVNIGSSPAATTMYPVLADGTGNRDLDYDIKLKWDSTSDRIITYNSGNGNGTSYDQIRFYNDVSTRYAAIGTYRGSTNYTGIAFWTANNATPTVRMRLSQTGQLDVDANVVAYSTAVSDRRLKKDIKYIDQGGALARILALDAITYKHKYKDNNDIHIGYVAQEIETIIPEVVVEAELMNNTKWGFKHDKKFKTVNYTEVVPYITEAMKEQQRVLNTHETEIVSLKKQTKQLRYELNKYKKLWHNQ